MQARTLGRNTAGNNNAIIELLVVFCLLCRLGFPGNLAQPFGGERIHFLIDYASSFLQLILIMLCSANTVLDIKLLDLKKKYLPIYVMLLIMYGISWMVTENPAKAVGMEGKLGVIADGAKADLVFMDLREPSLYPANDLISALCYSANGMEVESVMVDGRFVMKNREFTLFDAEQVRWEVGRIADKYL